MLDTKIVATSDRRSSSPASSPAAGKLQRRLVAARSRSAVPAPRALPAADDRADELEALIDQLHTIVCELVDECGWLRAQLADARSRSTASRWQRTIHRLGQWGRGPTPKSVQIAAAAPAMAGVLTRLGVGIDSRTPARVEPARY